MDQSAVNIGLHIGTQVIDLRVPRHVTIDKLKSVIAEGLLTLPIPLPPNWALRSVNKPIVFRSDALLSEYPISNGDQLAVVVNA